MPKQCIRSPWPPRHNMQKKEEAWHNLNVKVEMGSILTSDDDHSCPADILLPNWALGKPAVFDISVTSPLNPKIVSVEGLSAGAAALSTEERKHTENDPKCNVAYLWLQSRMVLGEKKP